MRAIKKNTEALVVASKETGLEENADRNKYMVMSQDQIAGWRHNMKTVNNSFERVEEFKYFGTTLTNQNSIQEEIRSRMRSGNACYHSVQDLLSTSFYECETWSLTLTEERRLGLFENRVLRQIFGPKRDEVTGVWRKLHEELNDLYSSSNIVRVIKSIRLRWAGYVARMGKRRGVYRVLVGKTDEKRTLGRPRRRWEDNIKMDLQEVRCGGME